VYVRCHLREILGLCRSPSGDWDQPIENQGNLRNAWAKEPQRTSQTPGSLGIYPKIHLKSCRMLPPLQPPYEKRSTVWIGRLMLNGFQKNKGVFVPSSGVGSTCPWQTCSTIHCSSGTILRGIMCTGKWGMKRSRAVLLKSYISWRWIKVLSHWKDVLVAHLCGPETQALHAGLYSTSDIQSWSHQVRLV